MATAQNPTSALAPTPPPLSPLAALLSYLIPGLGQVYQGRLGKGVLFFVCIYTLFFYGMFLGTGTVKARDQVYTVSTNVYLPKTSNTINNPGSKWPDVCVDLWNRPQFIGQFWVGVAAWPAVVQYVTTDWKAEDLDKELQKGHPLLGNFMRTPTGKSINAIHTTGDKRIELGWVFTVIAGVLNIMVIYDAYAGPAFLPHPAKQPLETAAT
jgi:hypothetical protein